VVAELARFVCTACLQRLKEFFDSPASPIMVDDTYEFIGRRSRLGREKDPFDGGLTGWRILLPHAHYAQRERVRQRIALRSRPLQRDARSTDRERRDA